VSTVAFQTLGCKVNFYDTEGIWQRFKTAGYTQVPFDQPADVYVINTCTVTHTGDKKSRQVIRRAVRTNPDAIVAVTGCYAQVAPEVVARIPGVDLVVGNDQKGSIVDLIEQTHGEQQPYRMVGNILKTREFEELEVEYFEERHRASLKIQDGCNNFCTFCIIPYARGLVRSRQPGNIRAQARKLAAPGPREIALTGIHTGGYGADLSGYRLSHLLEELEGVDGLHRVRISSIEASEIDDHLIEVLAKSTKVCHHLHIPLQAGHNEVLRRMNRHYTVEEFAAKLARLRSGWPDVAVTSDVIVGFPGETDEYFEQSVRFIQEQMFSQLHVFPYSKRSGTPAAKFVNQVPDAAKEARVQRLLHVSHELTQDYALKHEGRFVEVIPEQPLELEGNRASMGTHPGGKPGFWLMGHAANYLKVAFAVPDGWKPEELMGEVCQVHLTDTGSKMQYGDFMAQVTSTEAVASDYEVGDLQEILANDRQFG